MLSARGLLTTLMDEMMLGDPRLAAAIEDAERRKGSEAIPRPQDAERTG
jgi:hypothetical protein